MDNFKNEKYGINVKKLCRKHEDYAGSILDGDPSSEDLKTLQDLHEKKLSWLMHERLIHLIVLLVTVILALFSMSVLLIIHESLPASLSLFAIVFVLLIFYVRHYFFLENTVQRWYMIDEAIMSRSEKTHDEGK